MVHSVPVYPVQRVFLQDVSAGNIPFLQLPAVPGWSFFLGLVPAAIIDNPVDHIVVVLNGHFSCSQRIFFFLGLLGIQKIAEPL